MCKILRLCLVALSFAIFILSGVPLHGASAQSDTITWSNKVNISKSPDSTSTDPFLLADPSGVVHLFWAEKIGDAPGNQADTIMYAVWDGLNWSKPVDIFFSPLSDGNPTATYPHAVLDDRGWIHLIWLSLPDHPNFSLNYSSVPAQLAGSPQAWTPKRVLANNLSGTEYSTHMAYTPSQGLHIVYASGPLGKNVEKAVSYIHSLDYGVTWSEPQEIYKFADLGTGASHTRVLLVEPEKVFTSWTSWDVTGNGQAVLFCRSLDNGLTWDKPIVLDVRVGTEYERDWNNMVYLDDHTLVSFFEGGYRAYHQAMYSSDDGVTWSEPIDTFPWLIGENGFAEFDKDSNGTQYLFFSKRIREGNADRGNQSGLWSSVWEGGRRWREPVLGGGNNAMVNPKVVNVGGNRVVAAWYDSQVLEILVMTGRIENAPPIPPTPWPAVTVNLPRVSMPVALDQRPTPTVQAPIPQFDSQSLPPSAMTNQGTGVILGIIPAIIVVVILVIVRKQRLAGR
jgi:hypothetical protein